MSAHEAEAALSYSSERTRGHFLQRPFRTFQAKVQRQSYLTALHVEKHCQGTPQHTVVGKSSSPQTPASRTNGLRKKLTS